MNTLKKFLKKNMIVLTALGLVITLVLSSTVAIALADSSTPSGSGTSADPYIITTASQLANIKTLGLAKYYKLGNDIDLSNYGTWTPIGGSFTGSFDGNGYKITGMTQGSSSAPVSAIGLFGSVSNATFNNITLTLQAYGNSGSAGGLCYTETSSNFSNCVVSGNIVLTNQGLCGMLIGSAMAGTIKNCRTSGTITADSSGFSTEIGGLVGSIYSYSGAASYDSDSSSVSVTGMGKLGGLAGDIRTGVTATISNCEATGNVTGTTTSGTYFGGLIGDMESSVKITNSFSTGNVQGYSYVGGFLGKRYGNAYNCYESGTVSMVGSGNTNVGAFAGASTTDAASDCYYNSTVNTKTDAKATAESTSTMQAQSFAGTLNSNITSLSLANAVAWKYTPAVNGGYPYLNGIGVGVDTTPPSGTFSLSPSDSTPGPVTITLTATDDMSGVASIVLPDGSTVTTTTATYQVSANGDYDFTVKDNAGNSAVLTETVSNISATSTTPNLSIAATYALSSDSTNATVTADVTDDSGTTVSVMAYAPGTQTAGYFASAGTAITPSAGSGSGVIGVGTFTVSGNGDYTVYVKDSNGNEAVQTVTVSGIGSDSSSSSSDPGSSSSDPGSSSSDPGSSSSSETDTVGVSGTISASGISVTHPTTINYTIDANGNFLSPDFPITNNSAGPVKVTVESLKSIAGGSLQFTDVDPLSEDWSNLDLADSLKYIALGIGADTSTGWTSGESTNTFWSVNTTPLAIGDIASAGSASLKLTAYNGKVFDKSYTAEHSLVLEFDLD